MALLRTNISRNYDLIYQEAHSMAATYTGPPRASDEAAQKWFDETTVVDGAFRDLLEKYSHIPAEEVEQHVVGLVSTVSLSTLG